MNDALKVATHTRHVLGEGPTWDPVRERLLWVDIMDGAVYRGALSAEGDITVEERIDFADRADTADTAGTAGTVAVSAAGELVVAGTRGLRIRHVDGSITKLPDAIEGDGRRFNDGKPDPAGRLIVGTMRKGHDTTVEQLLRFEFDGSTTVLDDDLTLSNGLAWTADGRRMYSVDTLTRRIFVRDYDATTGAVGERTVFATLDDGYPDGITTDADDHVWVAVWGAACVLRFSPAGEIVDRIDVPAPHVTSAAFAGPELDILVITTATEDLTPQQLAQHPDAGALFTTRPGVTGLPPHLWAGPR